MDRGTVGNDTQPTLVLVHGAWTGAWVWERMHEPLRDRDVAHRAVELPRASDGLGGGWRVTLADYGTAVNAVADSIDGPVILIGHSAGGFAITQAASTNPSRYLALVYLAAHLPVEGDRTIRLAPNDPGSELSKAIRPRPLRGVMATEPTRFREAVYGDYEGDDVDALVARHGEEPLRPGLSRIRLSPGFHDLPKYYVKCSEDRTLSPGYQDWMCGRYGLVPVATLDSGHMPMLTDPEGLADLLAELVRVIADDQR